MKNALITSLVLVCCIGLLAGCGAAQSETQAKLAAISAGCAAELGEAGTPGEVEQMQAGCTTALRLLDPMRPDAGASK
jgi:hypothetical protein